MADELARRAPARAGELRARLVSELLGRTLAGERRLVSEVREVLAMPGNLDGLDTSSVHLWVDDARDSDLRALPRLIGHRGADYTAWLQRWFEAAPEHALVVRDDASPAFLTLWATADRHPAWATCDPLLQAWLDDAQRRGIAEDSVFQLSTDLVGEDAHFAQIVALVAGEILQRAGRTRVRWWYHAIHADDAQAAEWTAHLGSEQRTGLHVSIGSAGLASYVLDLGVGEHPHLPQRVVLDAAAVRAALRDIDQPVLLAAHPLARGSTVPARAAVRAGTARGRRGRGVRPVAVGGALPPGAAPGLPRPRRRRPRRPARAAPGPVDVLPARRRGGRPPGRLLRGCQRLTHSRIRTFTVRASTVPLPAKTTFSTCRPEPSPRTRTDHLPDALVDPSRAGARPP